MSSPQSIRYPHRRQTGIVLGIYPSSDPRFDVELQRVQGTSSSTGWATIEQFGARRGVTSPYYDYLPQTTNRYSYRARHVAQGWTGGAWTAVVSAIPHTISTGSVQSPPLSGRGVDVDLWLSSAASVKVGTKGSSGTVQKTIRFPATIYRPQSGNDNYSYGLGTLIPGSSTGTFSYRAAYVFPKNVSLTKFTAAGLRTGSASTCTVKLYRVSTAASATLVTTITGTAGGGGFAIDSSALSEAVDDANYWIGDLTMLSSAGTNAAHLKYTEFTYTIDDYQTAY